MNERKQKTRLVKEIFSRDVIYISQGLMTNIICPLLAEKSEIINNIKITFENSYGYLEVEDSRDGEVISFGFKIIDAKFIGANRYLKIKLIDLLKKEKLEKLFEISASIIKGISNLFLGQIIENNLILNNLHNDLVVRENDGVYFLDFSNFELNKFNLLSKSFGIVNISIESKRLAIKVDNN